MSEAAEELRLELTRRFEAPPERVFDAWLTRGWSEWLPPFGTRCEIATFDPRVGGRYDLRMTMSDGRVLEISGAWREIDRPKRLVFSWMPSYSTCESLVTVTFVRDGAGTLMTLVQTGFADIEQRERHRSGWSRDGGSFDKLAIYLGKGN